MNSSSSKDSCCVRKIGAGTSLAAYVAHTKEAIRHHSEIKVSFFSHILVYLFLTFHNHIIINKLCEKLSNTTVNLFYSCVNLCTLMDFENASSKFVQ